MANLYMRLPTDFPTPLATRTIQLNPFTRPYPIHVCMSVLHAVQCERTHRNAARINTTHVHDVTLKTLTSHHHHHHRQHRQHRQHRRSRVCMFAPYTVVCVCFVLCVVRHCALSHASASIAARGSCMHAFECAEPARRTFGEIRRRTVKIIATNKRTHVRCV